MRRGLNLIVKLLLALMVLFCIIWGYLLYKVKQPAFQQQIITTVAKQIGRKVEVKDGFSLSLLPLGVKLSGLVVESPNNWQGKEFVQVGDFRLQIKLGSLVEGKVEVERVVVKDFTINLLADTKRGNNWSYWGDRKNSVSSTNSSSETDLSFLQINSLGLENGSISLTQDGKRQLKVVLSELDLHGLSFHDNSSPVKWLPTILSQMDFTSSCRLASVNWQGLEIRDLAMKTQADNGTIKLSDLTWSLVGGSNCRLHGNLVISQLPVKLTVTWQVNDLQLRDLVPIAPALAKVSGLVDTYGELASSFTKPSEMVRHFSGNGKLELRQGVYSGIDIPYQIRRARDTMKKQITSETDTKQTGLDLLAVRWSGNDGIINLIEVTVDTPDCTMDGGGLVNLLQNSLDTKLTVKLKNDATVNVPLNIRGPLSSPEISLDLGQFLKGQITNLIPRVIDSSLNKALGKVETDGERGKDKAVNKVIERGLGKLFNNK